MRCNEKLCDHRIHWITGWILGCILVLSSESANANAGPSKAEQTSLARLDAELDGAVAYSRSGRIYKVVIGDGTPVDLGPGKYVRWSPHGDKLAVLDSQGKVFVMDDDGSNRIELASGAATQNCPLEFHTNDQEVIWLQGSTFKATHILTKTTRDLMNNPPHGYSGEPGISADGKRLACRASHDLYAIDLDNETDRKYADGCSAGVSPDGTTIMNNVTGHKELAIRNWDGSNSRSLHADNGCSPDGSWDNHHWSNHNDYIAALGDGSQKEVYVIKVSTDATTRMTWVGDADYPDLYVGDVTVPEPVIELQPASVSFSALAGTDNPDGQTVSIQNAGGGVLTEVSVEENCSWLSVTQGGTGNNQNLTYNVDISGLAVETYITQVVVSGGGASNVVNQQVQLEVTDNEQPQLTLNAQNVHFLALAGGNDPAEQTLEVTNSATGVLEPVQPSITWNQGVSDWLVITTRGQGNQQSLAHQVSISNLDAGIYTASVQVVCDNALNSPINYEVVLEITSEPTISVTQPTADTVWKSGSSARISWATVVVNDCVIRLSTDGGATWSVLSPGIDDTSEHWLDFTLPVPNSPSTQCVVRVEEYNNPSLYNDSQIFTIQDENKSVSGGCSSSSDRSAGKMWIVYLCVFVWLRRRYLLANATSFK